MTPATLKLSLISAGCVLVAALLWGYTLHQREVGALRFQLAARDSVHRVDSIASVVAVERARQSDSAASSLRAVFRAEQARDRAVRAATDSAVRRLASMRDSALALAADSGATAAQLQTVVRQLVQASDSAEAAHSAERALTLRELAAAQATIIQDSLALAHSTDAINAMTKRAVDSEEQVRILKRLRPSGVGGWAKGAAAVGVGYLAGRALK